MLHSSQFFHLVLPQKTFYCALVRSIIEYGNVLWDIDTLSVSDAVKRVQRIFLHSVSFRLYISCPISHNYACVLRKLGFTCLTDRIQVSNLLFLSNFLTDKTESPALLSLVNLKIPPRPTKFHTSFQIPYSSTNFLGNLTV